MTTIFIAIGALLVTFLIMLVSPLGFTMKGKLLVTLTSFLLSLGGITAVTIFSFWQAGLMLLALVLISAYFIDKKLNGMVYQNTLSLDDEELEVEPPYVSGLPVKEEVDISIPVKKLMVSKQEDESSDLQITPESTPVDLEAEIGVLHVQEDQLVASNITTEELTIDSLSDIESLLAKELTESTDTNADSLAEVAVSIEEEDISFLLERETEQTTIEEPEIQTQETGYLSDIESLLELESEEVATTTDDADIKDKDEDLSQLEEGTNPLDESIFEFLNKSKEADSDLEDTLEVIQDRKKIANL